MIKLINKKGGLIKGSKKKILCIAFKENCSDIHNTKIVDIYSTLHEYTPNITIYDSWVDVEKVKKEYGIDVVNENIAFLEGQFDAVILGVAHNEVNSLDIRCFLRINNGVVYDVKDDILCRKYIDGCL